MADHQPRDLTGTLFRNEKKTEDRHPSHTGSVIIGGKTYRLAAWVRDGAKGRFFSLKVTEPDQVPAARSATQKPRAPRRNLGVKPPGGSGERRPIPYDEIPF